jgi:hypothetical protein
MLTELPHFGNGDSDLRSRVRHLSVTSVFERSDPFESGYLAL